MTTAQVVEASIFVNNNSPIQDYVHPDDHTNPTYEMTPGFKPFTKKNTFQQKKTFFIPCQMEKRNVTLQNSNVWNDVFGWYIQKEQDWMPPCQKSVC